MISSTTSSSSIATGGTTGGLFGRITGSTVSYAASGGVVSSSCASGPDDPCSGAIPAAPVLDLECPAVPAIASRVVADPSSADADPSPSLGPPAVVVDSSAGR